MNHAPETLIIFAAIGVISPRPVRADIYIYIYIRLRADCLFSLENRQNIIGETFLFFGNH